MTAPVVSFTTPAMPLACANAVAGSATAHTHANTTPLVSLRIAPPGCRLPTGNRDTRTKLKERRGADKKTLRGVENTLTPTGRQAFAGLYCVNSTKRGGRLQKMLKWPVVVFGALLLAGRAVGTAPAQEAARPVDRPVTFSKDIAPIVYKACAPCHQPDGPAPFSLITYDEVRRHAAQIATVTARRYMPPWKPDPGFGDFSGDRRLSDVQLETIARWVAGGRLEGKRSDLPAAPRWSAGWQLGTPDLVVSLPEYTLRAGGTDLFRNFVVSVPGS